MKVPIKYFSLVGVILFVVILSRINISQLLSVIFNSNYLLLFLSFLIVVIEVTIRSAKWKVLINIFNKKYNFKDALQTYLIGFAFGSVTPSKTGDLVKIIDLKNKTNIDMKRCFSISVFDRIIDFLILIFTAIISTSTAVLVFTNLDPILIPILVILLVLFLSLLFCLTKYSKIMLKSFYYLIPKIFKDKVRDIYHAFREIIHIARNDFSFTLYAFLNLFAWVVSYFVPYIIARSIGLNISILYFLLLIPIIGVVEVLPISLFGIGSRDITLLVLFSPLGLKKEEIIGISMLLLLISMIPRTLAGFLISWKSKFKS